MEEEWTKIKDGYLKLDPAAVADIRSRFIYPEYEQFNDTPQTLTSALKSNTDFALWHKSAVARHKMPGYAIVTLSLKPTGEPPGDATSGQMEAML